MLSEIMSQIVESENFEEQYVTFNLNKSLVAIKLSEIETIQLVEEIVPIPRAPDHVLGIANIENSVIPIIDLSCLVSKKKSTVAATPITIIISIESAVFGLYSDELPKVIPLSKIYKNAPKSIKLDIPKDWILGYSKIGTKALPILNPDQFWVGLGPTEVIGP